MRRVIHTIDIKNFRGFGEFRLQGLNELTILTGRNGCGKSSLLDALLIGAAPDLLRAIGDAVQRHPLSKDGARWLFKDPGSEADIRLHSQTNATFRRIQFSTELRGELLAEAHDLTAMGSSKPFRTVSAYEVALNASTNKWVSDSCGRVVFALNGEYRSRLSAHPRRLVSGAALIDSALFRDLSKSFTKAVQQGFRGRLQDLLRNVLPGLVSIQILTEDDDSSNVYLEWSNGAVPLSISGDGIAAMLQVAIEAVLVEKGGLILVEEPEVFLHPKAISVVAGLLRELMREGRQVVITTHSLELIDSLLGRSEEADLDRMSLINLRPAEGDPTYVAWPGRQFDYIREKIGEDLR
jgi:predicted ATPase